MDKKRAFVFGTRPEIIKFAPLIKEMDALLIHTGQHYELAEEALSLFNIEPHFDLKLMKENQDMTRFVSDCLYGLEHIIVTENVEQLWVQGDTMSAFCGALAGFLTGVEVVHLEAGLRSKNRRNPYPEEVLRVMIDNLSSVHLAPRISNKVNLGDEGIRGAHVVGNTIVDALEMLKPHLPKERPFDEKYILVTMHRRESIGEPMRKVFKQLKNATLKVVFPCHPNPKIRAIAEEVGLNVMEPVDYETLLWYMRDAEVVVTDSGGIQEEAPSFGVPVIAVREATERPEIKGKMVGYDHVASAIDMYAGKRFKPHNPFGDGKTVSRIKQLRI